VGCTCGTYGVEHKCIHAFGVEIWGKETTYTCRWKDNIEMNAMGEVPLGWYGTWFAKEAGFCDHGNEFWASI